MNNEELSHLDRDGKTEMVDVSGKDVTDREAKAVCTVNMSQNTLKKISEGGVAKGPVLETARLAGIMAAKRTSDLIPLCHQIPLTSVDIEFEVSEPDCIEIFCQAKTSSRTGVEMEVLQGAAQAALTIYDMSKALEKEIIISDLRLLEKKGGKSGHYKSPSGHIESGEVTAVSVSQEKGTRKKAVTDIELKRDHGIIGDAHAGDWHRQVSLLSEESINIMQEQMNSEEFLIGYGDFAENIATRGIDLHDIEVGKYLKIGKEVVLEVTQIGKECHSGCDIAKKVGNCIMPKRGIFARVIEGGIVKPGDNIFQLEGDEI